MNLNALRLFSQVAHRGSFSRAAVAASISQPAISRAVSELEASIGLKLFDRGSRPLSLTPAGHCLFQHAETIFGAERDADIQLRSMRGSLRPSLRIAASAVLLEHVLAAPISEFMRSHPDIELEILSGNLHTSASLLGSGLADIAIIEGVQSGFEHLSTRPWREQELVLLVSPSHSLAARQSPVPFTTLDGETLITRESGSATSGFVMRLFDANQALPGKIVQIADTNVMLALCAAGAGVTIAPVEAAQKWLGRGELRQIEVASGQIFRTTLVARIETGPLSSSSESFLKAIDL